MLLNSSDIDTLEELDKNNQDYQLLVTDSADNLIGFLQKEDITW
jgi:peptide subunit release factor 1 (eRF1)